MRRFSNHGINLVLRRTLGLTRRPSGRLLRRLTPALGTK